MPFRNVDISGGMIAKAREIDPEGDYLLIEPADLSDTIDRRPVEDVLCTEEDYGAIYRETGLVLAGTYKPLGRKGEPYQWVNETRIAPWRVDVLAVLSTPARK